MTPRSLVGMTMGARKRRWARDFDAIPQSERASKAVSMLAAYGVFPKQGNPLAQRLRPCPGCAECDPCMIGYGSFCGGDPRLFTPDETRSTEQERERHRKHCEEWSSGKRLTATDSDKLVEQAPYGLGVSRWTNNSAGTFCDGSGVLPARAKKVRR